MALKVKKFGVIYRHKPKKGLLIKVLKAKRTVGFTVKKGLQRSTRKITAIWTYGKLDTIHPGKPSKTII